METEILVKLTTKIPCSSSQHSDNILSYFCEQRETINLRSTQADLFKHGLKAKFFNVITKTVMPHIYEGTNILTI